MNDLSLDEIQKLKFNFEIQENLDITNQKVINNSTIPDYYKDFINVVKENIYISENQPAHQKMMRLPDNSVKKNAVAVSKNIEKLVVTAVIYNAYKYGNLKYGPVLFIGKIGEENLLVDLSTYTQKGFINIPASIFARQISALVFSKRDSNFIQFARVKKIEPADEYTWQMFFPRSFVIEDGIKRAQVRNDMQTIFSYLVDGEEIKSLIVFKLNDME